MTARGKAFVVLKTVRSIAALGMLGAVITGALGYGSEAKLIAAAGTSGAAMALAVAFKVSHLVA